ncbi:MAG: TIGR01458 family HAD-type hydrolase [Alphaproteobacteria bacterium]
MIGGVLIDLSGVVYSSDEPISGAAEAIDRLREAGLPLRFVTNTTRKSKRLILEHLAGMGLHIDGDEVFTPAAAACGILADRQLTPHLLIHPALEEDFGNLPDGAETALVVGDAADGFTFAAMNAAFRVLDQGSPFFALAKNRTFLDADGKRSIDAGAFVTALEYASGTTATVLGKPSRSFFEAAANSMKTDLADSVMIGDDAEADVAGALAAGAGRAVLVRTGKYQAGDEKAYDPHPTAVVENIHAAADWILDCG